MIKRPKPTDTEDDILQMQIEFLKKQSQASDFQPAAKLVKIEPVKKMSKFAQERMKQTKVSDNEEIAPSTNPLRNIIIGNIVERMDGEAYENVSVDDSKGFPKPKRIDQKIKLEPSTSKSIFAQLHSKCSKDRESTAQQNKSMPCEKRLDFGSKSHIVECIDAGSIHKVNSEYLQNMDENHILMEQKRLLDTMDPAIVQYLKDKREAAEKMPKTASHDTEVSAKNAKMPKIEMQSEIDVLKDENSKNWVHFDVIEPSKLEWMRDLPNTMPELKPGEQYEARFDWKGVLLPFKPAENDSTAITTELYLHGDDAQRPGYTLQELFRLARSTVIQQRVSALKSVGGILSIYNQGYYDGIFELPISKVFFLLRYAFDDNTPSMLEESAKALSALFYNETDEVLLDMTFDCSFDGLEPNLEIQSDASTSVQNKSLEHQLSKMNIDSNIMQTNINDDDDDDDVDNLSSMNDFHLAETDLIQCILRTNILQRITYIFNAIDLENTTNLSCIKILIRLARTNYEISERILTHTSLLKNLMRQFERMGPIGDRTFSRHQKSQAFILKLFRILCMHGKRLIDQLYGFGLKSVLKSAVFVHENSITVETVKIQIEAVRCIRSIIMITKSDELIDDLMPALRYTLEWIYQFVIFQDETHFLFRQCASALIALLASTNSIYGFSDRLSLCFSKWFSMVTKYGNLELSQVVLLATCLNAIKIPDAFRDFLHPYLSNFLASPTYHSMCESLSKTSGILSTHRFRQQDHKPLPHLNSIVYNIQNSPVFIVSDRPTIYFISSLVRFYNSTKSPDKGAWLNDGICNYVRNFTQNTTFELSFNWFLRHEILFILDWLKSPMAQQKLDKSVQLQVAYKVLTCLTEVQINDVLFIYSQFIFNIDMYSQHMNLTVDNMNQMKSSYGKICAETYFNTAHLQSQELKAENHDRIPMLSEDWPAMLLLKWYKTPDDSEDWVFLPEKEAIWTTITFLSLQNLNGIGTLSSTEQFIYTMIAFLGKENVFLDSEINILLTNFVQTTFKSQKSLNFNSKFGGKFNFENLYISFLDQFQGASYGDNTFARLVMAPLAQKHDIKWRQMIWSEHIHVLRFVTCTEHELIGELNDYLEPPETDVILIKSYFQAINSSVILPNTVPYKIAEHHYNAFKMRKAQCSDGYMAIVSG